MPLEERAKVMPLLLHGDAAFAGQGVIAEILGLSGLRGHRVAGTLHFIINNQIGFTTNPRFSRSSPYPSDVAKMIEAPIFHVNGDDPEAVVYAAKVAIEFRMKFHKPVVVDMFCYRRFGHNEGDEPAFTQPIMYRKIRTHKTTVQLYGERLIAEGHLDQAEFDKMKADWRAHLESEWEVGQAYKPNKADWLDGAWSGLRTADNQDEQRRGKTAMPVKTLKEIGRKLTEVPKDFEVHKTIGRFLETRRSMIEFGRRHRLVDRRGAGLRLDRARRQSSPALRPGFGARHLLAAPLGALRPARRDPLHPAEQPFGAAQAGFEVINSMLSEEAVLGFEYGYSLAQPNALTLWEAQFGDFANGAQVLFDQFISSRRTQVAAGCRASSACCRTATRARGRSIHRRASSASCSSAPKTTCRLPTALRRQTTSISCAGR